MFLAGVVIAPVDLRAIVSSVADGGRTSGQLVLEKSIAPTGGIASVIIKWMTEGQAERSLNMQSFDHFPSEENKIALFCSLASLKGLCYRKK